MGQNGPVPGKELNAMGLEKLGRYDIIRTLGKGAMGMVYEARDPNLDRRVAIKTIKVEHLSQEASAEYEARFRTEARSAARLQHPNIVSVYDSDRHGDMAYLVMEFVQGDDLKKILDSGRSFTLEQSAHLMRELLAALDYAHRQNIVHRDVKPANLLVEPNGRVKLTDFGVARIQDSGEATRTRGSMVGTLKYMAPEQVQGLTVDARADIFAAGVVLYQLLTGRRPFDGASDFAIIQQIVGGTPVAPSSINAQLPPELDAVVDKALAKSRDDRFASAHAFLVALQEAVGLAPDPTILPPAGQRLAGEYGGTGSGALRSSFGRSGVGTYPPGSESSGSTVTQELELVYWKDVKESDDPVDLQGFLERFPQGIYADLARRRLKRLVALSRGENTGTALQTRVLDGSGSYGYSGFPPTVPMGEETLVVEDPSDVRAAALGRDEGSSGIGTTAVSRLPAGVPPGAASVATDSTAEGGAVAGATPAAAAVQAPPSVSGESPANAATAPQASAASAPGAESHVPPGKDSTGQEAQSRARSGKAAASPAPVAAGPVAPPRRNGMVLAVVAALFVAVGLAVWSFGAPPQASDGAPPAAVVSGAEPAALPASDASAAVLVNPPAEAASAEHAPLPLAAQAPASAPVSARPPAPALAPNPKPAAAKLANVPAAPASAGSGAAPVRAAAAVAAPVPPPIVAKPAVTRAPEPVVQASSGGGAANPEKACDGRVLLGYQMCMNEQCAKPDFAAHPICKQRRLADQARAAQQNNRN
jgi:eukaryotic-like serine/threonine-protein kinase